MVISPSGFTVTCLVTNVPFPHSLDGTAVIVYIPAEVKSISAVSLLAPERVIVAVGVTFQI